MSTPNPLIPQGTFHAQAGKGASNVRIAVATIVAIHVVFFGGLLLQGCKRDTKTAGAANDTSATGTNLSLPPIDSGSLFYTNASHLPAESTSAAASNTLAPSTAIPAPPSDTLGSSTGPTNAARDAWNPTNLGATPSKGLDQTQTPAGPGKEYTIARGDTYNKIATANGTTVNALRKANPTVDPSKLRPGMKIQIPAATPKATAATATTAAPGGDASGSAPTGNSYTVKQGDTLTKVAKAHGVTVSQLRAANNLKTSNLHVGQKIKIPAPTAGSPSEGSAKHTNTNTKATNRSSTNTLHSSAR